MGGMTSPGPTAIDLLGLVGIVGAAVAGGLVAPWLQTLVPPTASSARWFLRRPSVALVGVLVGLLAALVSRTLGSAALWPSLLLGLGAAAAACLVDAAGHRLPDVLVLRGWGIAVVGVLASIPWVGPTRALGALAASALTWGVFAAIALVSPRSIGFGDVKLVGLLALLTGLLGPATVVAGVLAAFVLGGVAALALVALRRARASTALAFGPWLLVGACCALVQSSLTMT